MYIGIDYSFTSPSICILGDDFLSSKFYFMNSVKKVCASALNYEGTRLLKDDYTSEIQRYDAVSTWAMECVKKHYVKGLTKIYMEGFSYGSTVGLVFNIAENTSVLKYKLFSELGEVPELLAPTSVKKYFTGVGNVGKDSMVIELMNREKVDIIKHLSMDALRSPAHDIVDSYAIAMMGRDLNTGKYKLPVTKKSKGKKSKTA